MSGYYTYYDDGFFGFGPAGTFKPFSLMHLIPLLICAACVVLVWKKKDSIRTMRGEAHLRYVLSFFMFLMEFGFYIRLLYVGNTYGQYTMMTRLPLQVCDVGMITCMFMITSKFPTLFGINFFVTLFGATLACIIPQTVLTEAGPAHFRYYQFFGEHLLPIFGTLYMMIIHGMKPRYRDLWIATGTLLVVLIPAIKMTEAYPPASYMFLRLNLPFMPENLYLRAAIYTVAVILIFHLMWFLWKALSKRSLNHLSAAS